MVIAAQLHINAYVVWLYERTGEHMDGRRTIGRSIDRKLHYSNTVVLLRNLQFFLFTKAVQLGKKRKNTSLQLKYKQCLIYTITKVASLDILLRSRELSLFLNVSTDSILLGSAFQILAPVNAQLFL